MRLHRVPKSIISNRDSRFTSKFWKSIQNTLGARLKFSTAFHLQADEQSEHTIQTLGDKLRAYALDFQGTWDKYLPLAEFSYKNSYHASIGMALYEVLYGRKYRSSIHWYEIGERKFLRPELVEQATKAIEKIQRHMKTSQSWQTCYADKRCKPIEYTIGE